MNTKLMASVSTLALVLSACASQEPKPLAETPEVIYKTAKVKAAVSIVPSWYNEMPEKKGSIFTVGSAVAPDLQFAVDIATMNAKVVLADRINGKLKSLTKSWMAKIGQTDVDASVMTEIEKVSKNVIANVDVSGYNPTKVDVFPSGTQYRAFVLLEYSDKEAAKIIFNRMRKDRLVYSRLRSNKAWKELEAEVYKSEKKDEAQSMANIEKLVAKPVVPVDEESTSQ
tara:strand:- start:2828 stop:3508 length:681 start_codon:yes stop_codon:yes gene_type:complete